HAGNGRLGLRDGRWRKGRSRQQECAGNTQSNLPQAKKSTAKHRLTLHSRRGCPVPEATCNPDAEKMRQGPTHKRHPTRIYPGPDAPPQQGFTLSASSRKHSNEFLYLYSYFPTSGPRVT